MVPVRLRIRQPLERDTARARSKDRALRAMVEGVAFPVWRQNLVFPEDIPPPLRQFDGHTAGKRHIHFARAQSGSGIVDRNQCR